MVVVLSPLHRCFQLCAYSLAYTFVACLSGWAARGVSVPLVFVLPVALVSFMFCRELVDRVVVAVVALFVRLGCSLLFVVVVVALAGCRRCSRWLLLFAVVWFLL